MKRTSLIYRIIAASLTLVMLLSLLPAGVFAADYVAYASGSSFTGVSSAWRAVQDGGVIYMLADWRISERLTVPAGKSITVNMNGHVIDRGLCNADYEGEGDGQVFYVDEGAQLTLIGGEGEHFGYVIGDNNDLWVDGGSIAGEAIASIERATGNEYPRDTLQGGIITGGACDDSDGAGAITMKENSKVILYDVSIAGSLSDCYLGMYGKGGAVRMDGDGCSLEMNNSAIVYNHAEDDGGAVYIGGEECSVIMTHSEISRNFAADEGGAIYSNDVKTTVKMTENSVISENSADEGGGIYFNYSRFNLRSSDSLAVLSNNRAESGNGGGVFAKQNQIGENSASIHGITFSGNHAADNGGAIYLDSENVSVSNCYITQNDADWGAGVYVNDDRSSLSGCTVTNNRAATCGGGVFVSSTNDLSLGGKLIIKNNLRGDGTADDLLLYDTNVSSAYIAGVPSAQSEIGIRLREEKERKLNDDERAFFENAFFYDTGDGYHIEYVRDLGQLWVKAGAKVSVFTEDVSPTPAVIGTFNGEPLYKGAFSYPSVTESTEDLDAVYFYSDGYFTNGDDGNYNDAIVYNEHLATVSMALAMSAFYSSTGNGGEYGDASKYVCKSKNVVKMLSDVGVADEDIYLNDYYTKKPETDSIGVAIGKKSLGDSGYTLVPIAVRGAGYESEWYGNTTVGERGEHEGFSLAADKVFIEVWNYVRDYGLTEALANGRVKFWIAGYSRAGATANLTARRLIEKYCGETASGVRNQVYAYCFEAPKGGLNSEMLLPESCYYSIHNCINKVDLVPLVAPEEMGFIRYGVDHYVPGGNPMGTQSSDYLWSFVEDMPFYNDYRIWYDNDAWSVGDADYNAQRTLMLKQLNSIDADNICFYDRFDTATVQYLISYFGGDLIKKDETNLNQEQFIRVFIRALLSWGLYDSTEGDFRHSYAKASLGEDEPSFQDALQILTRMFFSKSAADARIIKNSASGIMERISNSGIIGLSDIWDDLVGDWCTLSDNDRTWYSNVLWAIIVDGVDSDGNSIAQVLTDEEYEALEKVWYTVLDVLLRFVASDYEFDGEDWNDSHSQDMTAENDYAITPIGENAGIADTSWCQILLGTLVYNASTIMQAHYPEINFAWLRSYDKLYKDEGNKAVRIIEESIPRVSVLVSDGGESFEEAEESYRGGRLVKLEADGAGVGIYYRVSENGGDYSEWKPYNLPFSLEAGEDESVTYLIQTAASNCKNASFSADVEIEILPACHHVTGGPATCTEDSVCTLCGETVEARLGHEYENGVCKRCDINENGLFQGDADCDGEITAADVTLLRLAFAGNRDRNTLPDNADMNRDGVINAKDLLILRKMLAG